MADVVRDVARGWKDVAGGRYGGKVPRREMKMLFLKVVGPKI
jgi:hypothetical protein